MKKWCQTRGRHWWRCQEGFLAVGVNVLLKKKKNMMPGAELIRYVVPLPAEKRIYCCIVNELKANAGESPDPIVLIFSGVHVGKQLNTEVCIFVRNLLLWAFLYRTYFCNKLEN